MPLWHWWNQGEPSVHTTLCNDTIRKSLKPSSNSLTSCLSFNLPAQINIRLHVNQHKNSCFKEIDQTGRLFSMETPKKQSTHRLHPTVQPMCWLHIQHKHASWFPQAFMVRNVGVNHPKSYALACMGPIRIYLFGTPSILALWVSMGLQRDFAHRMSTLTWIAPPADGASRNTALTCREPVGTMKWWMINRLHFRISTIINYVLESVTSVFTASVCKHSCCLLRFEGAKHWRVQTPEQEQKKRASKYGIVHHTILYIYIWLICSLCHGRNFWLGWHSILQVDAASRPYSKACIFGKETCLSAVRVSIWILLDKAYRVLAIDPVICGLFTSQQLLASDMFKVSALVYLSVGELIATQNILVVGVGLSKLGLVTFIHIVVKRKTHAFMHNSKNMM